MWFFVGNGTATVLYGWAATSARGRYQLLGVLALAVAAFSADVVERTLPNGLTVLLKEVHAAPVVTVDMWYKVGSRNEQSDLTGGSHLLEHMTYRGTTEFAKDAMKTLVKRNGAIDNGATFYDYTHYYTTIASDRVALPLRIEASRLHSALIQQADLDSEMTVVRSELEGRENSPGGLLFQELMAGAFKAHPYRWPVVGWRADVEHMTAVQLKKYYQTYYMPNNATLVIVGDVQAAPTMALVRKLYGGIPRGPQPSQWATPEPEQRGERRVTVHRQGRIPMEEIGWHIPSITDKDAPALMLLEQILGNGRTARLYRAIVETKLGVSAWANALQLKDPGLFIIGGAVAPGQPIDPVEKTLLAEAERIKREPPTAEEMARALRQIDASLIFARDSVTDQAEQLGYFQTETGDWRFLETLPARLHAVTPDEVARVAKTYLIDDHRTIAVFQPTNAGKPTATPTAMAPVATPAGYHEDDHPAPLGHTPAVMAPGPAAAAQPAAHRERFALANGIVVIVQENHANPTVAVRGNLKAGRAYDPAGKAGLADMTANLLDRGTATRTSQQIAAEMENAAAELETGTGWETVGVSGKALSGDTELLIRNLADLVRNATFPQEELDKMREQALAGLESERDQPARNAYRNFYRAALPVGHPYRYASFDEEEAGTKAITQYDLLSFYHARYTPKTLTMAIVGDVKVAEVKALVVKYFGDWTGPEPTLLSFPPAAPLKAERVVMRIPDKSSVEIYVGHADTLQRSSPDFYAAEVMNMILGGGGALNSRMGDDVRDAHGLAYTIYSAFHASTGAGPWFTALGVNPANVDKAIPLVQDEIVRMRDKGVTDAEMKDAVAYITGTHAISLETNAALAGELMDAEYFHLGLDYPERMSKLYGAVTRPEVNAAARKYLHPDALVISIAGPYGQ